MRGNFSKEVLSRKSAFDSKTLTLRSIVFFAAESKAFPVIRISRLPAYIDPSSENPNVLVNGIKLMPLGMDSPDNNLAS